MCISLSGNTAENHRNTLSKFLRDLSPLAVEFVKVFVIKHFELESLHVEPSCGLDIVVYVLKCMFC